MLHLHWWTDLYNCDSETVFCMITTYEIIKRNNSTKCWIKVKKRYPIFSPRYWDSTNTRFKKNSVENSSPLLVLNSLYKFSRALRYFHQKVFNYVENSTRISKTIKLKRNFLSRKKNYVENSSPLLLLSNLSEFSRAMRDFHQKVFYYVEN